MINSVLFFEALGSQPRQKIIRIIRLRPKLTAGEISQKISEISFDTVRHHISVLVRSGIFVAKKEKGFILYRVNTNFVKKTLSDFSKSI